MNRVLICQAGSSPGCNCWHTRELELKVSAYAVDTLESVMTRNIVLLEQSAGAGFLIIVELRIWGIARLRCSRIYSHYATLSISTTPEARSPLCILTSIPTARNRVCTNRAFWKGATTAETFCHWMNDSLAWWGQIKTRWNHWFVELVSRWAYIWIFVL